jgi:hypothetical protein
MNTRLPEHFLRQVYVKSVLLVFVTRHDGVLKPDNSSCPETNAELLLVPPPNDDVRVVVGTKTEY